MSAVHSNVQGDSQTSICITIEPGLLLKGDILVRGLHFVIYIVAAFELSDPDPLLLIASWVHAEISFSMWNHMLTNG